MTDTEFLSRLPDGVRKPTEEEFEKIQFVYDYHPSISNTEGKDQIAMLYSTFGMRIICDMRETAKRAQGLESDRRRLKAQIAEIERELEELSMV